MSGAKKYRLSVDQCAEVSPQRVVQSSHGYKGVEFLKKTQNWQAYIGCNKRGTRVRLGIYDDIKDAAQAYDQAAKDRYGEKAHLNFPLSGEKVVVRKSDDGRCANGHLLTEDNTYIRPDGRSMCRACLNYGAIKYLRRKGRVSFD